MRRNFQIAIWLMVAAVPQTSRAGDCPTIDGSRPAAEMKAALDYYPKITTPQLIAGANCAMKHFAATREHDAEFRAEHSTVNYRYGRFLAEIADLQFRAAGRIRQTGGGTGINFYKRDIEVRTALLKWCLGDKSACDVYKQLGALANAYESAKEATDLHDWMLSSVPDSLVVKDALKVWFRALYSCPAWDFRPPLNGNLYKWKETCSPGCVTVARQASEALQKHGPRISSLEDQIADLVKSTKACESQDGTR